MSRPIIIIINDPVDGPSFEIIDGLSGWIVSLFDGHWASENAHYDEFPPSGMSNKFDEQELLDNRLRHGKVVDEFEFMTTTGFSIEGAMSIVEGL
jgi:hypothetical protein